MPQRMVANRRFLYKTRWLDPGQSFDVSDWRIARILKAKKKARDDYDMTVPPAELPSAPSAPGPGSLDALRAEAEAAGVKVDRRWGEERLRQEMMAPKPPEAAAMTTANTGLYRQGDG